MEAPIFLSFLLWNESTRFDYARWLRCTFFLQLLRIQHSWHSYRSSVCFCHRSLNIYRRQLSNLSVSCRTYQSVVELISQLSNLSVGCRTYQSVVELISQLPNLSVSCQPINQLCNLSVSCLTYQSVVEPISQLSNLTITMLRLTFSYLEGRDLSSLIDLSSIRRAKQYLIIGSSLTKIGDLGLMHYLHQIISRQKEKSR